MQPNLLVIGAPKSGTTSLHWYLLQHPDVFMPSTKEPHHFLDEAIWRSWCGPEDDISVAEYVPDPADYEALFAEAGDAKIRGEASVFYYLYPQIIERVRALPDLRIVVVLRDPVKRAHSNYLHFQRDGREALDTFEEALAAEPQRLAAGWRPFWGLVEQGMYAKHLTPWFEAFGDRIHVIFQDDLADDGVGVMQRLFRFLEIDDTVKPDTRARYNITGEPRSAKLRDRLRQGSPLGGITRFFLPEGTRRALRYQVQKLNTRYPEIKGKTRRRLRRAFEEDTRALEALLGRRVPWSRRH